MWIQAYLICRLIISASVFSTTEVQILGCCALPGSGKKQELFDCTREQIMCSSYGAWMGTLNETAIRRQIGSELIFPEVGCNSTHLSTESSDTGFRKSSRENEVVPIVLHTLVSGKLEGECDTSSKKSSPLGSHWKEATCLSPDSDRIVSFCLTLKNTSGCFLLNITKRFPLCLSGKFLTPTISKRT